MLFIINRNFQLINYSNWHAEKRENSIDISRFTIGTRKEKHVLQIIGSFFALLSWKIRGFFLITWDKIDYILWSKEKKYVISGMMWKFLFFSSEITIYGLSKGEDKRDYAIDKIKKILSGVKGKSFFFVGWEKQKASTKWYHHVENWSDYNFLSNEMKIEKVYRHVLGEPWN